MEHRELSVWGKLVENSGALFLSAGTAIHRRAVKIAAPVPDDTGIAVDAIVRPAVKGVQDRFGAVGCHAENNAVASASVFRGAVEIALAIGGQPVGEN